MSLTGTTLVSLLVVLAIGVPIALAVVWSATRRTVAPVLLKVGGVLLAQALAVAAVGVLANDEFAFYSNWADVLGTHQSTSSAAIANGLVPSDGSEGRVLALSVTPRTSLGVPGVTNPIRVLVWVPPQYDEPQFRHTRFPVTMFLPGQPGTPHGIFHLFRFAQYATNAIATHQVRPFVAVLPPIMIAPPRDTECTNVVGGPQAESWLTSDVRNAVLRSFRVTPDGRQWSAMGFSTGGYCAAKLLLTAPRLFHAAVGIGAYYDAETDHTTGDLYHGSLLQRHRNSPIWLLPRVTAGQARLLIVVSRQDRSSYAGAHYADSRDMIEATRGAPGVATLVLPRGGHNYRVYVPTIPSSLAWLGQNAGL